MKSKNPASKLAPKQKKKLVMSLQIVAIKNFSLPLSNNHSHFWAVTFDFTTFFMLHFLHGPHFFFTVWLFLCRYIFRAHTCTSSTYTYQYTPTSPCKDFLCNKNYSPKSVTAHPLGCSLHPC